MEHCHPHSELVAFTQGLEDGLVSASTLLSISKLQVFTTCYLGAKVSMQHVRWTVGVPCREVSSGHLLIKYASYHSTSERGRAWMKRDLPTPLGTSSSRWAQADVHAAATTCACSDDSSCWCRRWTYMQTNAYSLLSDSAQQSPQPPARSSLKRLIWEDKASR